ncbi:MAG: CHAD domain-containing protein [Desulfobulbaceae bacterium]|nr:CHAD domain-containing protein [Desulfobulbaceae bacterium]
MPTTGHRARTAPGGRRSIWSLPASLEVGPLIADLAKAFQVQPEKDLTRVRKWFDTHDWRLYRRKLLLFQEQCQWHLIHRDSEEQATAFSGGKCEQYRYSWDFPVSRMRVLLEPVLSIRSLLPLATLQTISRCRRILNRDGKTIALVYFDDHETRETGARFSTVTLKGMRGYDSGFKEVSGFFAAYGMGNEVAPYAPFEQGVRSTGRTPLDYSSKFRAKLQPQMTARQAMALIYRQLLETMERNEQGIIHDLDSEFLHDFRVAVRRTRSGLGLVRDVLPRAVLERAKKDFSRLGSITGATRDLDVYLLDREKYLARLPEKLRPHLDSFFTDMAGRRDKEQRRLSAYLRSPEYRKLIGHWHAYLHGLDQGDETPNSVRPVMELAREIICRRYTKVMKRGKAINDASPDEELHRLRIQCKKLRYAMEFFASLFPAAEIKRAVKQLKKLQDNLGSFNDLSVQQDMLRSYLAGLRPGSRKNQDLATAIGGLLTNLHHEQQEVRRHFDAASQHFSSEKNLLLYRNMFT